VQLRKLAALLVAFAVLASYGAIAASAHAGLTFGLKLSTAATTLALALFLELSARNVMRHLDADYAYWRALQDRRRPRVVFVMRALAIVGSPIAIYAAAANRPFVLGLVLVPPALSALMAIADLTGGWRPI